MIRFKSTDLLVSSSVNVRAIKMLSSRSALPVPFLSMFAYPHLFHSTYIYSFVCHVAIKVGFACFPSLIILFTAYFMNVGSWLRDDKWTRCLLGSFMLDMLDVLDGPCSMRVRRGRSTATRASGAAGRGCVCHAFCVRHRIVVGPRCGA